MTNTDSTNTGPTNTAAPNDEALANGGLSYEQARDELVRVVSELEQGTATLEDSIALWERGEALAQRCEQWLIGAKARLDAARLDAAQRDSQQRDSQQRDSQQRDSQQRTAGN
ncbi:exodeoxyribonuclease VII small subunit [Parafrigoribacterium mesophilum]|uniref:exodeoxyribonuclease VII small subunit n=1 Tax=Parafrigoribacterium mesophilum TaxID=433646 RepID=UPI0031FC154E